ncbi:MAG: GAF domain-containing protein [Anaerolineales bacterium]|nr:GAF domain-containing protein [Anaerolineales bacterium]
MERLLHVIVMCTSLAAATSVAVALYAWRRRQAVGAGAFAAFNLSVAIWCSAYALVLIGKVESVQIFWLKASMLGVVALPVAWLVFVLQYTECGRYVNLRTLALLALVPLVVTLLVWTNDFHHLLWRHFEQLYYGDFYLLKQVYGPVFWLNLSYTYSLVVSGAFIMMRTVAQRPIEQRLRAGFIALGLLFPLLASVVSHAAPYPLNYVVLTPAGFLFTDFVILWGVLRFRFLEIVPLAQQIIIENMGDGLAILDIERRIVYLNAAASKIINRPAEKLLGKPASQVLPSWFSDVVARGPDGDAAVQARQEITIADGETISYYELTISTLSDPAGFLSGQVVMWHNITGRKQAEQALRRQLQEMTVLHAVASACANSNDEDRLIERVTRIIGEAFFPDNFGLILIDESTGLLCEHPSYRERGSVRHAPYPLSSGITGRVALQGRPMRVADVSQEADYSIVDPDTRSELCVPLKAGERIIGVINAESVKLDAFSQADEQLLSLLADQIAVAIERLRVEAAARQRVQELQAITRISREINSMLDRQQVLESIVRHAAEISNSNASGLFLYGPDGQLRLVATYGVGEEFIGLLNAQGVPLQGTAVGQAITTRRPYQVSDIFEDPFYSLPVIAKVENICAILALPMLRGDEAIGGIVIWHREARVFTREDERFLQALANQSVNAIENARLFEETYRLLAKTREQAHQVQQIIDTVPEGVVLLDASRRVVLANPAARQHLAELLDDANMEAVISHLGSEPIEAFLKTAPEKPSRELQTADAPRRTFEVAACPLEVGSQSEGWVLVLRDVTVEREIQARIQMQERLATVGQLAAGIAHDFNNIMAAVVVYTDLLAMEPNLAPASRERLKIIQQQIHRATSLIRQILDFSRRAVMEQIPMDLLPFVKELEKLLARVLPENIRLELTCQPGDYIVKADPARLQQALMNLILNARDAMPSGGLLRLRLERINLLFADGLPSPDLSPGEWIRLVIEDNGVGIPEDALPHIFDPFFTTKPVGQGTGLGLAQAYGIIKQHKGSIHVQSEVGKGAAFTIYLPVYMAPMQKSPADQARVQVKGSGETVLIVEDDQAAREAFTSLLESQNYRVLSAQNGIQALEIFERERQSIALVVSDVVMPEMGGMALYQALKDKQPLVKVLFITGHPLDVKDRALLEKGRVRWLQKPFSIQEFSSAVCALLAIDLDSPAREGAQS